jgi:hypothetical protein
MRIIARRRRQAPDLAPGTRAGRCLAGAIGLLTLLVGAAYGGPSIALPMAEQATIQTGQPVGGLALPCRARSECGSPIKAGLRISFTGWACTSGFLARERSGMDLYLVTAGHCLASAGLRASWSHAGVDIGHGSKLALAGASASDAGAISILEDGPKNLMFGTEPSETRTLSALRPSQSQRVGTRVCRSGGSSGWTCGTVTRADEEVTIRGALIRHTWWTDFPSAEGDSGSPVIDEEGALMGIVIATTKSESLYLTVDAVSAVLGVRPCLDGACR